MGQAEDMCAWASERAGYPFEATKPLPAAIGLLQVSPRNRGSNWSLCVAAVCRLRRPTRKGPAKSELAHARVASACSSPTLTEAANQATAGYVKRGKCVALTAKCTAIDASMRFVR